MHVEPLKEMVQPNALHILDTEIKFKVKLETYKTLCKVRVFENLMVPEIVAKDTWPVGSLIAIGVI
jgi:hypothetical protein